MQPHHLNKQEKPPKPQISPHNRYHTQKTITNRHQPPPCREPKPKPKWQNTTGKTLSNPTGKTQKTQPAKLKPKPSTTTTPRSASSSHRINQSCRQPPHFQPQTQPFRASTENPKRTIQHREKREHREKKGKEKKREKRSDGMRGKEKKTKDIYSVVKFFF